MSLQPRVPIMPQPTGFAAMLASRLTLLLPVDGITGRPTRPEAGCSRIDTQPIFRPPDVTMRGYVLRSFLPLVLQNEPFRRMSAVGLEPRCTNFLRGIAADSDASAH